MKRTPAAFSFLVALLAQPLIAREAEAQTTPADSLPRYELQGVTVTGSRSAVDRGRITQSIDVVVPTELHRVGGGTVAELLRREVALDVIEFPGLLTGISIRGFRPEYTGASSRTLILQNGRPAGTTNLALLQLGGVERIEVMRGPASALYGSNAMGGVVNVITRRSTGDVSATATAGYGSFGGYEARLSAGGALTSSFDFDVALAATGRQDGYDTGSRRTFAGDSMSKRLPDGSTARLPWTSADSTLTFAEYGATAGTLRLGYAPDTRWRVELFGEALVADEVQNPGDLNVVDWDPRSVKDVERYSAELGITALLPGSTPTLKLYSAREAVDYYDSPVAPRYVNFRTPVTTYGAQLQNALRSGNHDLTVGADYSASVARSEPFNADGSRGTPYTPDASIESAAAFTQLRLSLLDDRLITTAGGRLDRFAFEILETPGLDLAEPNRETHSVFAPSAGARFSLVKGVQLTGNIGRGFITPTAFDVAGYAEQRAGTDRRAVTVTRGNPALRPEASWSWDAGIRVSRIPRLDLELTYFSTSVEDRIVSDTRATDGQELTPRGDTILAITTYHNVDEAEMRGIEGRASYRLLDGGDRAGAEIFAAGTRMLSAEERFVASDAAQSIHNVADLTLLGGVDVRRRAVGARLTARYVGERMDSDYLSWWEPGEIVYPPYLVLDLSAEIRASSRYRFGLELRNLLDEDYFEVRGYNMPGRALQLSVSADL